MAAIRKRCSSWNVQVRKKGYPLLTETFKDLKTALAWAKRVESEIDRYIYLDISAAQRTTVREVLPTKRGGDREKSRIKTLSHHLGKLYLADLKPFQLAEYRDTRLKQVAPSTVRKELGLLSRVLTATIKDYRDANWCPYSVSCLWNIYCCYLIIFYARNMLIII